MRKKTSHNDQARLLDKFCLSIIILVALITTSVKTFLLFYGR
jgi:hypothetical protein